MPFVMLHKNWPGTFRRTVTVNGKKRQLAFSPGEPVQLKPAEVAELRADIGAALQPVEIDSKGRPEITVQTPGSIKDAAVSAPA